MLNNVNAHGFTQAELDRPPALFWSLTELFRVIFEQRKQRELNPTLTMLRSCAEEVNQETDTDPVTKERIHNMLEFVESTSAWYEDIRDIPTQTLTKIMKLGRGITKLVRK